MKFNFKTLPYFIAEAGVNHENNMNLAEKIIKQASIVVESPLIQHLQDVFA